MAVVEVVDVPTLDLAWVRVVGDPEGEVYALLTNVAKDDYAQEVQPKKGDRFDVVFAPGPDGIIRRATLIGQLVRQKA